MTDTHTLSIGFVGFGNMAEAIWKNGSSNQLLSLDNTVFCESNPERQETISNTTHLTALPLKELINVSDLILFCVKPQTIQSILDSIDTNSLTNKCIGSILAGTPIQTFETALGGDIGCIRIMPNTPLMIGHGITGICANDATEERFLSFVTDLFTAAGQVVPVKESQMDCITALSGSGPAFFYRIVESFSQEATKHGRSYEQAITFLSQTLIGAGQMIQQSGVSCKDLIDQVKSPGGTTAAGLDVFDSAELDTHLHSVIEESIKRAKSLAKG